MLAAATAASSSSIIITSRVLSRLHVYSYYRSFTSSIASPASIGSTAAASTMKVKDICSVLQKLAPLELAEPWDNVGLLVEPPNTDNISKVMLTNDLTEEVLSEAISMRAGFILSYHPPIFRPMKRLTFHDVKQRIILQAVAAGIAVYSPHTAFDAASSGVNDWLAKAMLGTEEEQRANGLPIYASQQMTVKPITYATQSDSACAYKVTALIPKANVNEVFTAIAAVTSTESTTAVNGAASTPTLSESMVRIERVCSSNELPSVTNALRVYVQHVEVYKIQPTPMRTVGTGRLVTLSTPLSLDTFLSRVRRHTGLSYLRVGIPAPEVRASDSTIRTVALCAGSGSTVLGGVKADAYLTGEMGHHDVLSAVANGTVVVLTEHSNSERGFLTELRNTLSSLLHGVDVVTSQRDRDPLKTM